MVGVVSAVPACCSMTIERAALVLQHYRDSDAQTALQELRRWRVRLTTLEVAEAICGHCQPSRGHLERARAALHGLVAAGRVRQVGKLWELQS
jgi:hypothetical protein